MSDYTRFCINCSWNDSDFGCVCPSNEEIYQCSMYMHYHPEEVEAFNKACEDWVRCNDECKK